MSVLTHDCNVIKSQRSIPSLFKYYHNNSPPNHSHKNVFLRTNPYIKTFEDRGKINDDIFMSVAVSQPPPTSLLTRRILHRQSAVEDLSSITITYNNIFCDYSYFLYFLFTLIYSSLSIFCIATRVVHFNY